MAIYRVKVEFTEPMLGTAPADEQIYSNFIATKKEKAGETPLTPDVVDEELSGLPDEDRGQTVFRRDPDGTPYLYDYMWLGRFKESCAALKRAGIGKSAKLSAYKKVIAEIVKVYPRRIPLQVAGEISTYERPLRAQTMQGERVTLAKSEVVPEGTTCEFEVSTLGEAVVDEKLVRDWLDVGLFSGMGQFRNGSFGRYTYEMERVDKDAKWAPVMKGWTV